MSADDQGEQRGLDLDGLEGLLAAGTDLPWKAGHGAHHEAVLFINEPGPDSIILGTFYIEDDEAEEEDDSNAALAAAAVTALPDLIAAARERDRLRATGAVADAVARATPCTCSAQRARAERTEAEKAELLLSRAELADEVQRLRERVERHESGEVTAELRATVERVRKLHGRENFMGYCASCGYAPPCPTIRALGDQP